MNLFNVYPVSLNGVSEAEAISHASGYCFEDYPTVQSIKYARHISTVGGLEVYYDYGADYYFLADDSYWWTSGDGSIELIFQPADLEDYPLSGDAEDATRALMELDYIRDQLDALTLRGIWKVLNEYGDWTDEELFDRDGNELRLLWIAASDMAEIIRGVI